MRSYSCAEPTKSKALLFASPNSGDRPGEKLARRINKPNHATQDICCSRKCGRRRGTMRRRRSGSRGAIARDRGSPPISRSRRAARRIARAARSRHRGHFSVRREIAAVEESNDTAVAILTGPKAGEMERARRRLVAANPTRSAYELAPSTMGSGGEGRAASESAGPALSAKAASVVPPSRGISFPSTAARRRHDTRYNGLVCSAERS